MPNWAEGNLKVRGTQKEIVTFLKGAFGGVSAFFSQQEEVEVEENDYSITVKSKHGLHVNGTRRAFVDGEIEFYLDYEDDEIVVLVIDDFKQAWGIDPEPFIHLSKKFKVDKKKFMYSRKAWNLTTTSRFIKASLSNRTSFNLKITSGIASCQISAANSNTTISIKN
ncbi:hypothetical protein [Planococcus beigongshangi]|uniref:hypothetical protein n=1 Tax=Planococcus beigongshangi TaxID=2782536 RepID=UPI001EED7B93|nr:hypothetical protein [Planococcus beigongshangi]